MTWLPHVLPALGSHSIEHGLQLTDIVIF